MSIHQTTAAGNGPVRAYKGLGFQGGPGLYSLRNLFGMVVGEQNSGKSYLFQSCPDAFVINLDLSSTVSPHAKCAVWPGIGLDGRPMDVDGKPSSLPGTTSKPRSSSYVIWLRTETSAPQWSSLTP